MPFADRWRPSGRLTGCMLPIARFLHALSSWHTDAAARVITFDPHPRQVVGGAPVHLLTTLDEKLDLLDHAGVDNTVVVHFTTEFSRLSPLDFVERDLVGRLHIAMLLVGFNHHMGRDQSGNYQTLSALSRRFGFDLQQMPPQKVDSDKVSSTLIRQMVAAGDMTRAAHFMQSPYRLSGQLLADGIVGGVDPHKLIPASGDYAIEVLCNGVRRPSRLHIELSGALRIDGVNTMCEGSPIMVEFCS